MAENNVGAFIPIAPQQTSMAGKVPTLSPASFDMSTTLTSTSFIWVKNDAATDITLILHSTAVAGPGLAQADFIATIAANTQKLCGPFPLSAFAGADGTTMFSFSAVTTVSVAVIQV